MMRRSGGRIKAWSDMGDQKVLERVAGAIGALLALTFLVVQLTLGSGVVREHCLDVKASQATGTVQVDSHWTYIVWPPLYFAAMDPAGRCVRNTPLHEALSYVGIWKLPSPTEQVRRHVTSQLRTGSTSTNLTPAQSGAAQQAGAYLPAVATATQPLSQPPANPTDYAGARTLLNRIISQLQALVPPSGAAKPHRALIAALQRLRDLSLAFERASNAHDAIALSNLERKNIQTQTAFNDAIGKIRAYQVVCSSDVNRC
jgi:hypothetical protein